MKNDEYKLFPVFPITHNAALINFVTFSLYIYWSVSGK